MIEYRIYKSVYDEMITGKKNVEIRLLNEKSKNIEIGDKIKFQVQNSDLYLIVEVTNKYIYEDIDERWKNKRYCFKLIKNEKNTYMKKIFMIKYFSLIQL